MPRAGEPGHCNRHLAGAGRDDGSACAGRQRYPDGFALDATHHPHVTMLQHFVRTADLGKVYTAANRILAANEKVAARANDLAPILAELRAEGIVSAYA